MADDWHTLADPDEIPSPALLVYPERIGENIRRMIAALGQTERLRPHVKTHKMAEVVQLQLKAGISKFKCATIAEAEMLGQAGAKDVLLANQPVGPNIDRLLGLGGWFRDVRFSTIADDAEAVGNLAQAAQAAGVTLPVWLDLDVGMGRQVAGRDLRGACDLEAYGDGLVAVAADHDVLEAQDHVGDVIDDAVERAELVVGPLEADLGDGRTGNRRQQCAPQRVAERGAEARLERTHSELLGVDLGLVDCLNCGTLNNQHAFLSYSGD